VGAPLQLAAAGSPADLAVQWRSASQAPRVLGQRHCGSSLRPAASTVACVRRFTFQPSPGRSAGGSADRRRPRTGSRRRRSPWTRAAVNPHGGQLSEGRTPRVRVPCTKRGAAAPRGGRASGARRPDRGRTVRRRHTSGVCCSSGSTFVVVLVEGGGGRYSVSLSLNRMGLAGPVGPSAVSISTIPRSRTNAPSSAWPAPRRRRRPDRAAEAIFPFRRRSGLESSSQQAEQLRPVVEAGVHGGRAGIVGPVGAIDPGAQPLHIPSGGDEEGQVAVVRLEQLGGT